MKRNYFSSLSGVIAMAIILVCACNKNQTNTKDSKNNTALVPQSLAMEVAQKFDPATFSQDRSAPNYRATSSGGKASKRNNTIKNQFIINDSSGTPAMYVFNFANNGGSLFVSADFRMVPVLAYIEHGETPEDFGKESAQIPYGATLWTRKILSDYRLVRTGKYDNSVIAKWAWYRHMKMNNIAPDASFGYIEPLPYDGGPGSSGCNDGGTTGDVTEQRGPLLNVTWGQGCTYNEQCPLMSCAAPAGRCNQNALTGCVATAMSQVVNYLHPTNNFNYDYASMPASEGNAEVQRLMHDAGVSVGMHYGCDASLLSFLDQANVATALKNTFKIRSANYVQGFDLNRCTRSNIYKGWPVILYGIDPNHGGHVWVCDGCQTLTHNCSGRTFTTLHMNWGQHEAVSSLPDYIGWYLSNDWNIPSVYNPSTMQAMVTEIHN